MEPQLPYKSEARVFVKNQEHVKILEDIIKNLDAHEFEYYYPSGLIAPFSLYPNTTYTGKFEFPDGFAEKAKEAGIKYVIVERYDQMSLPFEAVKTALEDDINTIFDRKIINDCYTDLLDKIYSEREEILKAFVAKYGAGPDEVEQVTVLKDGGWIYSVRKKAEVPDQ